MRARSDRPLRRGRSGQAPDSYPFRENLRIFGGLLANHDRVGPIATHPSAPIGKLNGGVKGDALAAISSLDADLTQW